MRIRAIITCHTVHAAHITHKPWPTINRFTVIVEHWMKKIAFISTRSIPNCSILWKNIFSATNVYVLVNNCDVSYILHLQRHNATRAFSPCNSYWVLLSIQECYEFQMVSINKTWIVIYHSISYTTTTSANLVALWEWMGLFSLQTMTVHMVYTYSPWPWIVQPILHVKDNMSVSMVTGHLYNKEQPITHLCACKWFL